MAPATSHQLAAHQLHERPVRENFLRCPGCPDFACLSALSPLTIIPLLEEEPLLTWLHHHRLLTIDTPCRCGSVRKKYSKKTRKGLVVWYLRCLNSDCPVTDVSIRSGLWRKTSLPFSTVVAILCLVAVGCRPKTIASNLNFHIQELPPIPTTPPGGSRKILAESCFTSSL
ncbi:hypothetical protein FOZ60_012011 [Perkinsus olseni]|uniref:Uncharacterized protein n=1 Tax=Perkinsus olseni TaxID=32597 RepID=A0A7J6PBZ1_PEROL|nr:hypothetical protein FOZ60_012011 [Perkinsus olseni]